jgi:myo-inositol-1(or 4)-monophosphatase
LTDWQRLLTEASQRAMRVVRETGSRDRARALGRGASGDKTLVADRRAEDVLLRSLESVGDLGVLSEERGRVGRQDARYLAVLDPLDGSSNFSRGIPFYCTSIGVLEGRRLRDARYALVRDLVHGDVFYAERGRGAWKNGKRISVSRVKDVSEAIVGIDISMSSSHVIERLGPLLAAAYRQVHLGANALELCMVAEGRVDAFVDIRGRMRITDLAAAYLIALEAGARVTGMHGEELDPAVDLGSRFSYVAAGKKLHEEILALLGAHSR